MLSAAGDDKLEKLYGSEYSDKRGLPYIHTWSVSANCHLFTVFSFAFTPTGRISKYWCSKTFNNYSRDYGKSHYAKIPEGLRERVKRWVDERPRLKRGYRWSAVYAY